MTGPETTRFAPSPTGELHLGHALAALLACEAASVTGGRFLVRLEDLDAVRCQPRFATAILDDLAWLGLAFETPVWRQSERLPHYRAALATLQNADLVYPCFCTRGAIAREIEALANAPQGPDGPLYPGTCRDLPAAARPAGTSPALRLDVGKALARVGAAALAFEELGSGPGGETGRIPVVASTLGDIVLARKDTGVSYHLAVVVDDAAQGVTLVTRGEDLFAATHVQRLLQQVLDLPAPRYQHHRLVTDVTGRRLAKRDRDQTLVALRQSGVTPAGIRDLLGLR